ncbi:hypothetical protein ACQZV8_18305 [Magnetococcales bacterium HHB-1]
MALLNVSQAAKVAGVSRTTIYNSIKNGSLSATNSYGTDGSTKGKLIESSELLRVFGTLNGEIEGLETVHSKTVSSSVQKQQLTVTSEHKNCSVDTPESAVVQLLRDQLTMCRRDMESHIKTLQEQIEDLKTERDRAMGMLETVHRMLPAPAETAPEKPSPKKGKSKKAKNRMKKGKGHKGKRRKKKKR